MSMTELSPNVLVVDVLEAHGRVLHRQRFEIPAEGRRLTFGRSPQADVMLDDTHVASLHMALDIDGSGILSVSDLDSRNGIIINHKRLSGVSGHRLSERQLKLGRTALRFHLASDERAPEVADAGLSGKGRMAWTALVAGVVCLLLSFYSVWLEAPKDIASPLMVALVTGLIITASWVGIWSLLTRIMQGEWRWLAHTAVFLSVMAVSYLLELVLGVIWFALELPRIDWVETVLLIIVAMVLIYGGLLYASPLRRRNAAIAGICLPLIISIPMLWMGERNKSRDVNFISANPDFYPSSLRLRDSEALDKFFASAVTLRQKADEARKKADELDLEDGEDSDE